MSTYQNFSMPPDRFLTVSGNVVYKALVEAQRADAKRLFREVSDGKRVKLMTLKMDDDTEVRFDLQLDHSEFRGDRINFKFFRNSVAGLLSSIGQVLKDEGKSEVPVFKQRGGKAMLFGVPGVTQDTGEVNVLMLAADLSEPGAVRLKLQYMDPSQFRLNQQQAG